MSAGDEDLTRDAFLGGRVMLWQPRRGYRAATDPVLLAAAIPAQEGESVLDLGCGAGAAALCLAARVPGLDLHGIELQPDYAALARRNAAENGTALTVHDGDIARMPRDLRALSFDHVMSNPPFFAPTDLPAPDAGRDIAQREGAVSLTAWIEAGLRRLRPGGHLTLVQRTERLPLILSSVENSCGSIAVLPLQPREGRAAGRVLVQCRKGARGPFRLCPPLVLHSGQYHAGDGDDFTPDATAILRHGARIHLKENLDSRIN